MKSLWPFRELSEIVEIERDQVLPREITEDDVYVGLENIESGSGRILQYVHARKADLKSNKFRFGAHHILYGKLRPYLNKVALPEKTGICSTDILPIRPKDGLIERHFLAYLMRSEYFSKIATARSSGANLPRISPGQLEKIKIPLPPREIQKAFSLALQKLESALEKRREAIRLLDDFLKSTFLEMFGDPILNSKGLRTENASDLFVLSSGKFNPTKNLDDAYPYPTYGGNGITGFSKEYLIDFQTVVIGRVGAYCGCVHLTRGKSWITDNAIYIKEFAQTKIDIVFLFWLFQFLNLRRFAGYSGQPKITQEPIQRLKLLLPPLSEQQRFLRIVQQTEQLGQKMKSSETELQNLFAALMQKAFKGDIL